MSDLYKDPIIQKIIDLLEANGPTELRGRYLNGDVLSPGESELPMAYITKDTVPVQPADNLENEERHMMVLTVIYDMKRDFQEAYDMVAGSSDIMDICEGRDLTNFRLKSDTLMYQLLKNEQVAPKFWIAVGNGERVILNYGMGVNRRGPGMFSVEATIRFTAVLHMPIPGMPINE